MVSEKIIISVEKLRFYCNISDSYDADWLVPYVIQATDLLSESILGTSLTNKLIEDYNVGPLTGKYEELYPLVEKMVCWQTYVLCLPNMSIRISNGQITTGFSENPTADINLLAGLQRTAESTKVMWENRVKGFICGHSPLLPELKDCNLGYLSSNTTPSDTSMGTIYSHNRHFNDF